MALISLKQLLDHAQEYAYGVPAFNVNNLEQIRAIMDAAQQTQSPVIIQASAGARKYAGPAFIKQLANAALEEWPEVPICLTKIMEQVLPYAWIHSTWVLFGDDGWITANRYETPSSYEYNVSVTAGGGYGACLWRQRRR